MKTSKSNGLAILGAKDGQFPKRAISLLEIMQEFCVDEICLWISFIRHYDDETRDRPRGAVLTRKRAEYIRSHFERYKSLCEFLGWEEAGDRLGSFLNVLACMDSSQPKNTKSPTAEIVNTALSELWRAISDELNTRRFVVIDKAKFKYVGEEELNELFGKSACIAFPLAQKEFQAAGECLALDLNTAAVFHLMRVSEFGMRALAVHLKVKLKNKPIEHGGWNEIIEQIEKKVRLRRDRYDKSSRKNKMEFEFLKFCRMMADELYKFKEIWRNNTMHSISSYNEAEAKGVFDRVRDFMQRLSKEVSENN